MQRSTSLLEVYNDVFRLELGMNLQARVDPLKIELTGKRLSERRGGRPRTFSPLQRQFLDNYLQLLLRIRTRRLDSLGSKKKNKLKHKSVSLAITSNHKKILP